MIVLIVLGLSFHAITYALPVSIWSETFLGAENQTKRFLLILPTVFFLWFGSPWVFRIVEKNKEEL